MTDFKAKMHQIRFRLGELTALSQTPLLDLDAASRQGRGWAGEEEGKREGKGRRGKGKGKGRGEKGREGRAPPIFYCTPSSSFLEMCLPVRTTAL